MSITKVAKDDVVLQPVHEGPWAGSNLAEVFSSTGRTRMSCGVHELFASDTVVDKAPVDDVLFILEGEIEIESDGKKETFRAGDFAYLHAGARQRFVVRNRVKHIYVTYPCNWQQEP
ncbi:MAG TPA: cupin domain-containing protein [Planctomycetota bacterium]|nr:cupin domain-containing protein [Planctomycetota bacterium]